VRRRENFMMEEVRGEVEVEGVGESLGELWATCWWYLCLILRDDEMVHLSRAERRMKSPSWNYNGPLVAVEESAFRCPEKRGRDPLGRCG
jgi:hypothetical protein